jgi:predicted nucleic acid-binding protein
MPAQRALAGSSRERGILATLARTTPRLSHVHAPAADDVLAAISLHQETRVSFWDAMILRSAKQIGCQIVHSEDLNPGQDYEGVQVRNPFGA